MSIYGYVTKKDLSGWGSFLFMGLIIVFIGFTAYDTQKLKELSTTEEEGTEMYTKLAIVGALTLYLDFVNLFVDLLSLIGDRD